MGVVFGGMDIGRKCLTVPAPSAEDQVLYFRDVGAVRLTIRADRDGLEVGWRQLGKFTGIGAVIGRVHFESCADVLEVAFTGCDRTLAATADEVWSDAHQYDSDPNCYK